MTNGDLINKIKVLKEIRPDEEWKESNRVFLLSKISGYRRIVADKKLRSSREEAYGGTFDNASGFNGLWYIGKLFRFRPAMAAVLVVIFTIIGSAYAINISQRSLPGDMLWNVKLSLEKAQVTFSSLEGKVKLETEFAGKRLEELKQVTLEEKPKAVAEAVENFKIHINEAKKGLEELEDRGFTPLDSEHLTGREFASPGSPTEVGTPEGEEPTKVGQNKLAETYAAIMNAEDEYELWEEELIGRIKTKIENARRNRSLKAATPDATPGLLLQAEIDKAEALLKEERLVEALEKMLEVERMID